MRHFDVIVVVVVVVDVPPLMMVMTTAVAAAMTVFVFNFSLVAAFSPCGGIYPTNNPIKKDFNTVFVWVYGTVLHVLFSTTTDEYCNFEIFTRSTICTLDTTLFLFFFFFSGVVSRKQRNRSRSILAGTLRATLPSLWISQRTTTAQSAIGSTIWKHSPNSDTSNFFFFLS